MNCHKSQFYDRSVDERYFAHVEKHETLWNIGSSPYQVQDVVQQYCQHKSLDNFLKQHIYLGEVNSSRVTFGEIPKHCVMVYRS